MNFREVRETRAPIMRRFACGAPSGETRPFIPVDNFVLNRQLSDDAIGFCAPFREVVRGARTSPRTGVQLKITRETRVRGQTVLLWQCRFSRRLVDRRISQRACCAEEVCCTMHFCRARQSIRQLTGNLSCSCLATAGMMDCLAAKHSSARICFVTQTERALLP